jgi:hypothetical protein
MSKFRTCKDETGLWSRPEEAREQKIIGECECQMKRAFRKETDSNHILMAIRRMS